MDVHSGTLVDDQTTESLNVALKEEVVFPFRALKLESNLKEQSIDDKPLNSKLNDVSNP